MSSVHYHQPTSLNLTLAEAAEIAHALNSRSIGSGSNTKGARTLASLQLGVPTFVLLTDSARHHLKLKLERTVRVKLESLKELSERCQKALVDNCPLVDEMGEDIVDPEVQYRTLEARLSNFVSSYISSPISRIVGEPLFGVGPDFQVYVSWIIKTGERVTLFVTGVFDESPYYQLQLIGDKPVVAEVQLAPVNFPRLLEEALQSLQKRSVQLVEEVG